MIVHSLLFFSFALGFSLINQNLHLYVLPLSLTRRLGFGHIFHNLTLESCAVFSQLLIDSTRI
jgi:hypothetical protein